MVHLSTNVPIKNIGSFKKEGGPPRSAVSLNGEGSVN